MAGDARTTPAPTRLVFRVVVEGPWDAMTDPAEWARYFQMLAWNNLGSRDEFRVEVALMSGGTHQAEAADAR